MQASQSLGAWVSLSDPIVSYQHPPCQHHPAQQLQSRSGLSPPRYKPAWRNQSPKYQLHIVEGPRTLFSVRPAVYQIRRKPLGWPVPDIQKHDDMMQWLSRICDQHECIVHTDELSHTRKDKNRSQLLMSKCGSLP